MTGVQTCALPILLVGAAVGRRCASAGSDLLQRLRVLGVAALVLALGSAVLGALAGGRLGAAAFDPVDVPLWTLAMAVLAATLLGGCAPTLLSSSTPGTEPSTPDTTDGPDADHDDEVDSHCSNPVPPEPTSRAH